MILVNYTIPTKQSVAQLEWTLVCGEAHSTHSITQLIPNVHLLCSSWRWSVTSLHCTLPVPCFSIGHPTAYGTCTLLDSSDKFNSARQHLNSPSWTFHRVLFLNSVAGYDIHIPTWEPEHCPGWLPVYQSSHLTVTKSCILFDSVFFFFLNSGPPLHLPSRKPFSNPPYFYYTTMAS